MKTLLKAGKYFLYTIGVILLVVILFALAVIIPIDETPHREKAFYTTMENRLDSIQGVRVKKPLSGFSVGFGKANLTPSFPVATAGYGNRWGKSFTSVHDSIYVRTMVIDNGTERIAMVSADLLVMPPTVTALLEKELPDIGFTIDNTYLGATHTHNSIGNWGEGVTSLLYGKYNDSIVHFIADKIKQSILEAVKDSKPASIKTGTIAVPYAVRNRLDAKNGTVDSLLRVVEVHRSDSTKSILLSYTAHATCLYSKDLEISRDYPGVLVDNLEREGYSFAMFMAGAVGSHGCDPPKFGWPCLDWMSDRITTKLQANTTSLQPLRDSAILMVRIPLALGEPQVKISKNWRIRPWIFEWAFGRYQPYLTALRIGDIVFLGTPCDFSGELTAPIDEMGRSLGLHPIVTSFNGQYIGYITSDKYYDRDHYETRLMNWYGPGNGAYLTECLVRLTQAVAD